jgi:hypothetical protein
VVNQSYEWVERAIVKGLILMLILRFNDITSWTTLLCNLVYSFRSLLLLSRDAYLIIKLRLPSLS